MPNTAVCLNTETLLDDWYNIDYDNLLFLNNEAYAGDPETLGLIRLWHGYIRDLLYGFAAGYNGVPNAYPLTVLTGTWTLGLAVMDMEVAQAYTFEYLSNAINDIQLTDLANVAAAEKNASDYTNTVSEQLSVQMGRTATSLQTNINSVYDRLSSALDTNVNDLQYNINQSYAQLSSALTTDSRNLQTNINNVYDNLSSALTTDSRNLQANINDLNTRMQALISSAQANAQAYAKTTATQAATQAVTGYDESVGKTLTVPVPQIVEQTKTLTSHLPTATVNDLGIPQLLAKASPSSLVGVLSALAASTLAQGVETTTCEITLCEDLAPSSHELGQLGNAIKAIEALMATSALFGLLYEAYENPTGAANDISNTVGGPISSGATGMVNAILGS